MNDSMTQHVRIELPKVDRDFGRKDGLRTWFSSPAKARSDAPARGREPLDPVQKKITSADPLQAARGWNF